MSSQLHVFVTHLDDEEIIHLNSGSSLGAKSWIKNLKFKFEFNVNIFKQFKLIDIPCGHIMHIIICIFIGYNI